MISEGRAPGPRSTATTSAGITRAERNRRGRQEAVRGRRRWRCSRRAPPRKTPSQPSVPKRRERADIRVAGGRLLPGRPDALRLDHEAARKDVEHERRRKDAEEQRLQHGERADGKAVEPRLAERASPYGATARCHDGAPSSDLLGHHLDRAARALGGADPAALAVVVVERVGLVRARRA